MKTPIALSTMAFLALIMFASCADRDPETCTVYSYQNSSSNNISVEVYSPIVKNGSLIESKELFFDIPIGENYEFTTYGMGGFAELCLYLYPSHPTGWDSVIVSNGIKEVIHRSRERDALYKIESYSLEKPGKYTRKYTYTFRDVFFEE